MKEHLKYILREKPLMLEDLNERENELSAVISNSKFLVLGGAGSIGSAVVKEVFKRLPMKLHVVDLSENNLAELVRDIRNSYGFIDGDFKTFALDIGSSLYDLFIEEDGDYDYVLNLSALKHVRSEKDKFTLMRMIEVNVLNTIKTIEQSSQKGVKKYFCVSSDKAANPTNMMGASKRIMELAIESFSDKINVSTARFANVAFSDGSLLNSFENRIRKNQGIVAPLDIERYFMTSEEAGQLCLLSCIFGNNLEVFFPRTNEKFRLISLSKIAANFLKTNGFDPIIFHSEKDFLNYKFNNSKSWPLYLSKSNTSGEKPFEEFYTENEHVDFSRFHDIGILTLNGLKDSLVGLDEFIVEISNLTNKKSFDRVNIIDLFESILPSFQHDRINNFLDEKI